MPRYYLTQETPALICRLAKGTDVDDPVERDRLIGEMSDQYKDAVLSLLGENLRDTDIRFYSEEEINECLSTMVAAEIERDPSLRVVCLDRFLLSNTDLDIVRFEITRMSDDTKDARPGSPPIGEQLDSLVSSVGDSDILLVDDGLFTGGSIRDAMRLMTERGLSVKKVLAFVRDPSQAPEMIEKAPVEAHMEMVNIKDWIDMRDFLTFCGRTHPKNIDEPFYTTQYYLAPGDNGAKASLDGLDPKAFLEFSKSALDAEDRMLEEVERAILKRSLLVRDLVDAGFAVSRFPGIDLPSQEESYRRYIAKARSIVEARLMPKPDSIVFYMGEVPEEVDGDDSLGMRDFLDGTNGRQEELVLVTDMSRERIVRAMRSRGIEPYSSFGRIYSAEDFSKPVNALRFIAEENDGKNVFFVSDSNDEEVPAGMIPFRINDANPLSNLRLAGTVDMA